MSTPKQDKSKKHTSNDKSVILIYRQSDSELGRLLDFEAITPFYVVNFHKHKDDHNWDSLMQAVKSCSPALEKWLKGETNVISLNDENRLIHLMKCKFESNNYLYHLFIESTQDLLFVPNEDLGYSFINKQQWLLNELYFLRKYYLKSFRQGFHKPYIRKKERKPYLWR